MSDMPTTCDVHEKDKEIINILIDSDLYLDMDLPERYSLLRFLAASYFQPPAK